MINLVIRYRIKTNINSPTFVTGNYVEVNWDDVANAFVVYKYADSSLTSPTTITSGPNLGTDRIDYEPVTASRPIPYSFCDGTDLQTFGTNSGIFPYAKKISTPNHFSCVSAVCDLAFSDTYRVIDATDTATNDGSISVTASGTNGDIRYSLDADFDYNAGEGQSEGNFLNLYPGEYTVTAKDALGCIAQITVTVSTPEQYGVRLRLEFTDRYGRQCRTDIEERGYEGAIEEVCGGSHEPVAIRYNASGEINKFLAVIPSELELTLRSDTNFQFHYLFSQDERKYKVKHYQDFGNTIDAVPEIPGDTLPMAIEGVANWNEILAMSYYAQWVPGSGEQTVTFTPRSVVTSKGTIQTVRPFSGRLYTDYAFVEGNDYDITAYFDTDGTNRISISIRDEFGVVQFSEFVDFTPGSSSVNIQFTATAQCKSINIVVTNSSLATTYVTLTNVTGFVTSPDIPAVPGGPAGLELIWQGFIISSNYQEAYIAPPYPVTITATDGLADLKNYDFADALDNLYTEDVTCIKAITDILQRTDLQCNFISGINKFDVGMSSGVTDDPLAQSKFNPETFYFNNKISNGLEAITHILKPFGAILKMRKGKFYAYIMEQAVDEIPYREFTSKGVYVGNGTFDDVRDINYPIIQSGALFRNRDQVLEKLPTFGRMYFEHTLLRAPSLIGSYSFEDTDLYEDVDGTKLFRNWNVNINSAPGATYGIKETRSFEGSYNFYYAVYNPQFGALPIADMPLGYERVILTSKETVIEYNSQDLLEVKFNYAAISLRSVTRGGQSWIRLKWMLKIGDAYYNENQGGWIEDDAAKYNEVILTDLNDSKEFKALIVPPDNTETVTESMSIEFVFETRYTFDYKDDDYSTFAEMTAIPTIYKAVGNRVRGTVLLSNGTRITTSFVLEDEEYSQDEDVPLLIRPDDYHATTNKKVWRNEGREVLISIPDGAKLVSDPGAAISHWYLDNVVVRHYPNGTEPPSNTTIERINNRNIKVDFEDQYLLNDIDTENINNSERTYINYFKLLDGTPTQEWTRTYREGSGKLLELLSSEFVSQYRNASDKITGSLLCHSEILPTTVLREVNNGGKKYKFMGYEYFVRDATVVFDLAQISDVVTDDESEDVDADFSTDFSLDFFA